MNIVDRIRTEVKKADPSSEVILFGSRARGDNRPDSNWDLLILVSDPVITNEVDDKFRGPLYEIELDSGNIISTFIYPRKVWEDKLKFSPLYKHITQESKRL